MRAQFPDAKFTLLEESQNLSTLLTLAKRGNPAAMVQLGFFHEFGCPPAAKVPEIAHWWYLAAALENFPAAFYHVGVCYMRGTGVEKDPILAKHFLQLGAKKGDFFAKSTLEMLDAEMFENVKHRTLRSKTV